MGLCFYPARIDTASSAPAGQGLQHLQSMIAIGSGGVFGQGYLHGTQAHLNFVPESHTDFVFSVLAEEWGLAGNLVLLAAYTFFIVLSSLASAPPRGSGR